MIKLFRVSFLILPAFFLMMMSGCSTTRAHKSTATTDPQHQVADLQNQLVAKDQEIQDLRYQLDSNQQSIYGVTNQSFSKDKYGIIKVKGLSGIEVQKALARQGYDPGPIDGKVGKKTKSAVKAFQKSHGLTADGVVGDRTWSALR